MQILLLLYPFLLFDSSYVKCNISNFTKDFELSKKFEMFPEVWNSENWISPEHGLWLQGTQGKL